jgi:electron transfer flavoprotein beta subunit
VVTRIVVCTKQVVDPDGLNAFAIAGRLAVDETGRGFVADITRIMNAYDEQAIEAALRLRDGGLECTITAVCVGSEEAGGMLRHALAMGCDNAILVVDSDAASADGMHTARLLAAAIEARGGADLVLCGRQGSDYDQGVVPAVLAEALDTAYVTIASDVRQEDGALLVRRVTPVGDELVRVALPATVTISNELGTPRYPTGQGRMRARRTPPDILQAADLTPDEGAHVVELVGLTIPEVQGRCEFIEADTPARQAGALLAKLREAAVLSA